MRVLPPTRVHSEKITLLNHLEFRCWIQFLLSADDFGVMPFSAALMRSANMALATQPSSAIEEALRVLLTIELVVNFWHHGREFIVDPLWQDCQKIRVPRMTYCPIPPHAILAKLSPKTARLFLDNHPKSGRGRGDESRFQVSVSFERARHRAPPAGSRRHRTDLGMPERVDNALMGRW